MRNAAHRFGPDVLRHDAFRMLFCGQALSLLGDRITPVAIAFGVLGLGASATQLGVVMAASGVPYLLLSVAGGVLSDRAGRLRVMVAADVVRTLVQCATAWLLIDGHAAIWMFVALSAAYGGAAALFMPALIGLIPQTVPPGQVQQANALFGLARSVATVAGPVIAGTLIAVADAGAAIAVDAAGFALSAACLLRVRVPMMAEQAAARTGFVAELRAGWLEVRRRTWLGAGLAAMAAYQALALPAVLVLGPVLAQRELDGARSWAGILTCLGVGAIIGNLLAARVTPRRPVLIAAGALAVACLQGAVIGSGMSTVGIAAAMTLVGAAMPVCITLWDTSIQQQVPPNAISRVSAYDFGVSMGLMPLGMASAGPLAGALGLHAALWCLSASSVLVALGWFALPAVRNVTGTAARQLTDP
jgi:MFS family permease